MIRPFLTNPDLLPAASLVTPRLGHAQTFTVERFDIKGKGSTDYIAVEVATGRMFVSRATHVRVIDATRGTVLGDLPNLPGVTLVHHDSPD